MQSTFLSLPNLHRASSLLWGGGGGGGGVRGTSLFGLAISVCATLQLRYGFEGLES